jgi:serine/threonine protein kinase
MRLVHPNIISLLDYGVDDGCGIVVMPWYAKNLAEYVASAENRMGPGDLLLKLCIPILEALAYAHENGVDHRDIKPNNVLISNEGIPIVADWGSAKIYGSGESTETVVRFSSGMYTPEVPGEPMQHDVYSYGLLFLFILLKNTFKSSNEALEAMNTTKNISIDTKQIITKCLSRWPEARWANAAELRMKFASRVQEIQKNRVAKQNAGWIKPTKNVAQQLSRIFSSSSNSLLAFEKELNENSLYLLPIAKTSGGYETSNFSLISNRFKMDLKSNDLKNGWLLDTLKQADSDDFEYLRERSLCLDNMFIPWRVQSGPPAGRESETKVGYDYLLNVCAQWIDKGMSPEGINSESPPELSALMNKWAKLMEVKEDIYSHRFAPLNYEKLEIRDKIVSILLREPTDLELEDTYWKIPFDRPETAQVTFHVGNEVQLLLRRDPKGRPKKEGILTPDLSGGDAISINRQKSAVTSIKERTCFQPRLAEFLADPSAAPVHQPTAITKWHSQLDESKKEAVAAALGSRNFALIQGPPGTGKTAFIAEYIAQEIDRDPNVRILLVSQTHVALDNALSRLSTQVGVNEVVRLGRVDDNRIREENKKFLLDNQLQAWKRKLLESSDSFALSLAQEQGVDLSQAKLLIKLGQFEALLTELNLLNGSLPSNDDASLDISEDLEGVLTSIRQVRERIEELTKEAERVEFELSPLITEVGLTVQKKMDLQDIVHLRGAVQGGMKLRENFLKLIETQSLWSNKVGSSSQIASLFLRTRRVLTGTCIGFLSVPEVRDLHFDICIVDEASKATVTELLVPMTKSAKWVIVGDSRQLSADDYELSDPENSEILAKYEITLEDVRENLFELLESRLPRELVKGLNIQYRMAEPIGSLVSKCFYDEKLKNSGPDVDVKLQTLFPPVMWQDTAGILPDSYESKSGNSYVNRREIEEISRNLSALRNFIELGLYRPETPLEVLILAPYAAQIELARNTIKDPKNFPFSIEFNSVDAVQGREADIVFFSCVRNNHELRTGFLNRANWRRINVALSRAKYSLVIVGHSGFWENTNSALGEVFKYISNHPDKNLHQVRTLDVN